MDGAAVDALLLSIVSQVLCEFFYIFLLRWAFRDVN